MSKLKQKYYDNLEKHQTRDAVYITLKDAIIENKLEEMPRLKEEEIAALFNISRTPVREALLLLEHNGFIVLDAKKGYITKIYNIKESIDIIEYTRFLRSAAASITASKITDQQILLMEEKRLSVDKLKDIDHISRLAEIYKTHQEFHLFIAKLANNKYLYAENFRMHQKLLIIYYYYTDQMKNDFPAVSYLREHKELIAAFKKHDAQQASAVVEKYASNLYLVIHRMYNLKRNFD